MVRLRIVKVDDSALTGRIGEAAEQFELRLAVLLPGAVEVQVVAGEVGEHGDVEVGAVRAPQRQRMRGNLRKGSATSANNENCTGIDGRCGSV